MHPNDWLVVIAFGLVIVAATIQVFVRERGTVTGPENQVTRVVVYSMVGFIVVAFVNVALILL